MSGGFWTLESIPGEKPAGSRSSSSPQPGGTCSSPGRSLRAPRKQGDLSCGGLSPLESSWTGCGRQGWAFPERPRGWRRAAGHQPWPGCSTGESFPFLGFAETRMLLQAQSLVHCGHTESNLESEHALGPEGTAQCHSHLPGWNRKLLTTLLHHWPLLEERPRAPETE